MPRKQRFKPSRKPKPVPVVQTERPVETSPTNNQYDDMGHGPETEPRAGEAGAR
jgi:hypothetical protein